jgi:hypothetical protein
MTDSYSKMCKSTRKESVMKIAKDYSNVPTIYYRPEMMNCLECEYMTHHFWLDYLT